MTTDNISRCHNLAYMATTANADGKQPDKRWPSEKSRQVNLKDFAVNQNLAIKSHNALILKNNSAYFIYFCFFMILYFGKIIFYKNWI